MFSPRVAKRYAKALFELAIEQKQFEEVAEEIRSIQQSLSSLPELRMFVANPVLSKEAKKQVIQAVFEKKINPLIFNFLLFLIEKKRLNLMSAICEVFDEFYMEYKNIVDLRITSVYPVDDQQLKAIYAKISEKFHKQVRPSVTTDAGLIGGIKLRIQDVVYDFSFKSQLEKFHQSIASI